MRYLFLFCLVISLNACNLEVKKNEITFASNPVIAHRGAWKSKNHPQNSIASLKQAISLGCTGSEFDVRITKDSILIVTHDGDYNDLIIEESTYSELSKFKLSNNETLPTLKQYLLAGIKNNTTTGLVCEIKPSKTKEKSILIAEKAVKLVKELKAEKYILSYISFSYDVLKKIHELDPEAKTQFLDNYKSPEQLKQDSISGLDFYFGKYKYQPELIKNAKALGLILNAWTVNKPEDMDWLLANEFNYITTDEPELAFKSIEKNKNRKNYKLVWSDEFNYKGKPDNTKWNYDYGFLSNREEQYYTDNLKNVRIENGHLIIETHKEQIANKDFNNPELKKKDWTKYITEIKTAKYTSARLNTFGLASWKYGRIEVKAKLPKGVGLWPAIWMLGNNRKEAGWPECGEIDIMEHVGFNPDSIFGTIHTKTYNHLKNTERSKSVFIDKPYDLPHVFAIEWTPEKIDFILDNVIYNHIENEHKTTDEWPFDEEFYMILNVSVGGMLGGQKGIDDNIFPQKMLIDYVRVFQKKENK